MPRYEYRYRKPQRRKTRPWRVLLIIALVLAIVYPLFEAFHLNVQEHTTNAQNLPANLRNLKVVFLTDIHQNAWNSQARTDNVIKTVNGLSPDLVLLGGDYAMDPESAVQFFNICRSSTRGWACSACWATTTAANPTAICKAFCRPCRKRASPRWSTRWSS